MKLKIANGKSALSRWSTIIEKTTDLFMRMDTDQAEMTATVLFAADMLKKDGTEEPTETDILASVLEWKKRHDPPLNQEDVASAIRNLGMLRWLTARYDEALPVPADEMI